MGGELFDLKEAEIKKDTGLIRHFFIAFFNKKCYNKVNTARSVALAAES